jgi:hypothetical protein
MALQLKILAKIALLARNQKAMCTWVRTKWDEASNNLRVIVSDSKLRNSCREAVWAIMVCKQTLLVSWPGKQILYNIAGVLAGVIVALPCKAH